MAISSKKVTQIARRWMRAAGIRTRSATDEAVVDTASTQAAKGHFAVYTIDGRRFVVPLAWLANDIFCELLKVAEEEFGLPRNGPITLPFEASFMEDVVTKLMQRRVSNDLKEAFLSSLAKRRCSSGSVADVWANGSTRQLAC